MVSPLQKGSVNGCSLNILLISPRRDLFYRDVQLFKKQGVVDKVGHSHIMLFPMQ